MPLLLLFKQQTLCCLMRWVLEWGVFRFNRKAMLGFAVVYIALLRRSFLSTWSTLGQSITYFAPTFLFALLSNVM